MKRFIEVKWLDGRDVCREILDANSIRNIHVEHSDFDAIVIVLDNGKVYREEYQTHGFCLERFNQLSEYLNARPFTVNHLHSDWDDSQEE